MLHLLLDNLHLLCFDIFYSPPKLVGKQSAKRHSTTGLFLFDKIVNVESLNIDLYQM